MIALTLTLDGGALVIGAVSAAAIQIVGQFLIGIYEGRSEATRYRKNYLDLLGQMSENTKRQFEMYKTERAVVEAARAITTNPSIEDVSALRAALREHDAPMFQEFQDEAAEWRAKGWEA